MFDSQLCSEENVPNITAITKEMYRVLKPGGIYLCVSHGLPPTRLSYLNPKGINWSVEFRKVRVCEERNTRQGAERKKRQGVRSEALKR